MISLFKEYPYSSVFASKLVDYIGQKRLFGFSFELQSYWLYRFDEHCRGHDIKSLNISKDLFEAWANRFESEGKSSQLSRLSALRGFCKYLNTIGINAYTPHKLPQGEKTIPHIFNDSEVHQFFTVLDSINPYEHSKRTGCYQRMAQEYRVYFRLIYCCGLRNSEACNLKMSDVNLSERILTIRQSKGRKDRLVYMSDELTQLCKVYKDFLQNVVGGSTEWFFPGKSFSKPLRNTSMCKKFDEVWSKTTASQKCSKKPTIHSFRYYFVIKRMNLWMNDDTIDIETMLPYLSNYLGHSSPSETYYYYHYVQDAFTLVRKKDLISDLVIPEVPYE